MFGIIISILSKFLFYTTKLWKREIIITYKIIEENLVEDDFDHNLLLLAAVLFRVIAYQCRIGVVNCVVPSTLPALAGSTGPPMGHNVFPMETIGILNKRRWVKTTFFKGLMQSLN